MAKDKDLKDYLHRLLVPAGFRPDTNEAIEKTLDAVSSETMPEDTVARILAKAKGDLPMSFETKLPVVTPSMATAESEELMALHRGEGDTNSDEVNEKLERYRRLTDDEEQDGDESNAD